MFTTIVSFLKNPKKLAFLLGAGFVLMVCLMLSQCSTISNLKQAAATEKKINTQNDSALKAAQTTIKLKDGETETLKAAYVSQIGDLKNLSDSLFLQVKKEKGIVNSLVKAQTNVNIGTISVADNVLKFDSSHYGLGFHATKKDTGLLFDIHGMSKFSIKNKIIFPGETILDSIHLNLSIVMGFEQLDKEYRVFCRSSSPLVSFSDISSVLIIPKPSASNILCPPVPKPKKFGLGFFVGAALGSNFKPTPAVGIGFTYTVIRF